MDPIEKLADMIKQATSGWQGQPSAPTQKKTSKSRVRKDPPKVWRQGDVFIISTGELPAGAAPRKPVLAEGEVTGHAHRLADTRNSGVFGLNGQLFLSVTGDEATVVHEEHGPVTVPRGCYEIRIQREYHPKEIRRVVD